MIEKKFIDNVNITQEEVKELEMFKFLKTRTNQIYRSNKGICPLALLTYFMISYCEEILNNLTASIDDSQNTTKIPDRSGSDYFQHFHQDLF